MKKTLLASALLLATGAANAASVSSGGTFDMYDPTGALINSDATISAVVDQTAGTWGVSSSTPFYGLLWNAHDGALYGEGSHSIDASNAQDGSAMMDFTVGAGQIAGHILFNWGATVDIDVVNVWDINADGSLSYATVPGMVDGAFPGFAASFELTGPGLVSSVPVPAAAWLFGSGLLGLVGVARRRKAA